MLATCRGESRRHVDHGSADRVQFETLISDISARFVAAPPEYVEPVVETALDHVRRFFGADRCLLLSVSPDEMAIRVAYGAYAEDLPPCPPNSIWPRCSPGSNSSSSAVP